MKYLICFLVIFLSMAAGRFLFSAPDWATFIFAWGMGYITYLHLRMSDMVKALGLLNLTDLAKRTRENL